MPRFDSLFGFDEHKSEEGTWFNIPDGGRLKLGMIGSHIYNQALDRHIKKYRNLIRATGNLTVEQNTSVSDGRKLSNQLMVELKKHAWERNYYTDFDPSMKDTGYIEV